MEAPCDIQNVGSPMSFPKPAEAKQAVRLRRNFCTGVVWKASQSANEKHAFVPTPTNCVEGISKLVDIAGCPGMSAAKARFFTVWASAALWPRHPHNGLEMPFNILGGNSLAIVVVPVKFKIVPCAWDKGRGLRGYGEVSVMVSPQSVPIDPCMFSRRKVTDGRLVSRHSAAGSHSMTMQAMQASMKRFLVVVCAVLLTLSVSAFSQAQEGEPDQIYVVSREITANRPHLYHSVYAEAEGVRMVSIVPGYQSDDNGVTWTTCPPVPDFTAGLPYGYRRNPVTAAVDPNTDRLVTIVNSLDTPGLDPGAVEPAIALSEYYLRYRVSEDGGRTWLFDEPIIHEGAYTQEHPFDGIEIGTNAFYLGDIGCIPMVTNTGRILVPVHATMLDENGDFWNPTGQLTYTDVFVAIGTWNAQSRLEWTASNRVQGDPALSTRGMIEPTLAQFGDGRILMVMRGSNAGNYSLPGTRWFSVSQDDGDTWTDPQPWTYEDGQTFYSPSSMSTLITHSSGRVFWVGNLLAQNPQGNLPRYPVVMGEVDPTSLSLKRDSVLVVDTRTVQDATQGRLDLSHYAIIEDRQTEELVLTYPRYHNSYSYCEWATVRLGIDGVYVGPEVKNSINFDFMYEMDALPSTLDLDENSVADFTHSGSCTVDGNGVLTMPLNSLFISNSNGIWQNAVTFSEGWTVEARIKIIEQTQGDTAWQVFAAAPGRNSAATLRVDDDGQGWQDGSSLGTVDNTDDFHVFRVVQHPGSTTYSVWRDGLLIAENILDVYDYSNYFWFGDGSGGWSGSALVDYLRITPGAYVPGDYCPGDANGDNRVDQQDAQRLASNWGQGDAIWAMGDFDDDRIVGPKDAAILAAHWGYGSEGTAGVPEPASVGLLLGLGVVLLRRHRRRS